MGRMKGRSPFWAPGGHPGWFSLSLLPALLQPTPLLKHVAFFSTSGSLLTLLGSASRKPSTDTLNSLTSLLPSRVTDFSDLDQNLLVSRGHSPLLSYTDLLKSVFYACFTLPCGKPEVSTSPSLTGLGTTHDQGQTLLTSVFIPSLR